MNMQPVIEAIDTATGNRGVSGAAWVAHEANVPIVFENGDIALFEHEGDKDYQVHFLFNSRGRQAIEHARESFRRMFVDYEAELIFGLVPDDRRDVKMLARWAGGKFSGLRYTTNGKCELFVLSNIMWKGGN